MPVLRILQYRNTFGSLRKSGIPKRICLTGIQTAFLEYLDAPLTDPVNRSVVECHDIMSTTSQPLNELPEDILCPGSEVLRAINQSYRQSF